METSRKLIIGAIILVFLSQFFTYETSSINGLRLDWNNQLVGGGAPLPGGNGWKLHKWWFFVPAYAILIFKFLSASQKLLVYYIGFVVILLSGLGTELGGTLGFISTVIAGYAVYKRRKEKNTVAS